MSDIPSDKQVVDTAYIGKVRELRDLLDAGGNPNAQYVIGNNNTFTALTEAYAKRHYGAMSLLLARGANPACDFAGDTVLHTVARQNDLLTLNVFLDHEVDFDQREEVYLPMVGMNGTRHKDMTPRDMAEKLGFSDFVERIDRYKELPPLPPFDKLDKAALFERNGRGDCMLDNPATWRRWEAVSQALADKGEMVTKAELLQQNADGKPYLDKAVACHALPQALASLNAQGEYLRDEDLLKPDGEPNNLLKKIVSKFEAGELFTQENWAGADLGSLRRLYQALPDAAYPDVMNYHMLRYQMAEAHDRAGMGR